MDANKLAKQFQQLQQRNKEINKNFKVYAHNKYNIEFLISILF